MPEAIETMAAPAAAGNDVARPPAPDWRDVKGAHGPASAAWLALSRAEDASWLGAALVGLLGRLGNVQNAIIEPEELAALGWHLSEHVDKLRAAQREAMDLLAPLSQAEKAQAAAEKAKRDAEASTPESRLRVAQAFHDSAARMLRDAKAAMPPRAKAKTPPPKRHGKGVNGSAAA
jgi:signal transduction histidine kinase